MSAAGISAARSALRSALDRQGRADSSAAWLADETAAQAARDKLAGFGCDVARIEMQTRHALAALALWGVEE